MEAGVGGDLSHHVTNHVEVEVSQGPDLATIQLLHMVAMIVVDQGVNLDHAMKNLA